MNESGELEAVLGDLARHPSRESGRIDKSVMARLIGRIGQTQIADFFAVSEAAVSRMKSRMQVHIDRNVATGKAASQLMEANLLSGARLLALAGRCEALYELCNTVVFAQNEFAPEVMEAKNKLRRLVGYKGNVAQVAVALLGESRKQLEFVHNIQR